MKPLTDQQLSTIELIRDDLSEITPPDPLLQVGDLVWSEPEEEYYVITGHEYLNPGLTADKNECQFVYQGASLEGDDVTILYPHHLTKIDDDRLPGQ